MKRKKSDNPNNIKNWAEDDRPREKMLAKGCAALSDTELVAILIQSGNKEKSAVDLAREVMTMGNFNLSHLGKFDVKDFQRVRGIGKARAVIVTAALELGRRRQFGEGLQRKELSTSKAAAELLIPLMQDLACEKFCVLCLSHANKLLHYEFVSSGGLTSTIVDPKLIFKIAVQYTAGKLIIAHNHPSGHLKPSEADRMITARIKSGAGMLDIRLVDHLIIADEKYYSFADEGLL